MDNSISSVCTHKHLIENHTKTNVLICVDCGKNIYKHFHNNQVYYLQGSEPCLTCGITLENHNVYHLFKPMIIENFSNNFVRF